jgi:hypothetical protein
LSFERHKEVVTGLFWGGDGRRVLYGCSKDGIVMRHAVDDALQPFQDAADRSHGVCFEPRGGLARFDDTTTLQSSAAKAQSTQRGGLFTQQAGRHSDALATPTQPTKALSTVRVLPQCDPSMCVTVVISLCSCGCRLSLHFNVLLSSRVSHHHLSSNALSIPAPHFSTTTPLSTLIFILPLPSFFFPRL